MPKPFGAWHPAMTMAELKARTPRLSQFSVMAMLGKGRQVYYSPEAMAHFKDPQQFRDSVDTVRKMMYSDKITGHGMRPCRQVHAKTFVLFLGISAVMLWMMNWFYSSYVPANNPSWRKVMNKEWEEAINTSPWDHRTHVWKYCDMSAACLGDAVAMGQRKFYIPA